MQPIPDFHLYTERQFPGDSAPHPSVPDNLERLYHYSGPSGLLGIIKSKSIWFSHVQYQNDGEEFNYAVELLKTVLEEEYELPHLFEAISRFLPGGNQGLHPVFTYSLTTKGDSLSQWRGYCPNGGYAYSIHKAQLVSMMASKGLLLAKCLYQPEEQKQFIRKHIVEISPEEYRIQRDTGPTGNPFAASHLNEVV